MQTEHPESKQQPSSTPTFHTIHQFCEVERAFTPGGLRHLFFTKGHDMPGVYRFGRKLLIQREEFMEGIKQGHAMTISGRGAK